MRRVRIRQVTAAAVIVSVATTDARSLLAQNRSEDEYTRYELLAPETSSFTIIYDVTAVSPGAKFFFNPIRAGSVATDESVIDLMSGAPLRFQDVSGAEARESGLPNASLDGRYIRVELARPVPQGGESRIRIIKTYRDREIVYFLKSPETHAFSLYHDYTEVREGTYKYVNIVRAGSTVSDPSAKVLDTGETLTGQTLKGPGDRRRAHRHRRERAARFRGRRRALPAGQEGTEPAAPHRGDLHRSSTLRSHRRTADVAAQLRASPQRPRTAGGMVFDGELDSRHHHSDRRRTDPAGIRQPEAGFD